MAEESRETRNGLCGICPAGCFVTVTLEKGGLVSVGPQAGTPMGILCRIGRHSPQIVHDPDRLLYPLKRVGPKGKEGTNSSASRWTRRSRPSWRG
ncbi:Molybdopterin-binding domain/Cysteine desulfurase [Citrifermentans bremense]|uniref:Molybdopterin-binding domain/Cysteine desulfurase n=1 Tax=Citrifermentans bremense TaxID=60035 RepID=A0A6S6M0C1_9BACT|nr:hypothetical protein [Citrifermentans bremense]BCG47802.1 Molybdopterin-binding domain/Cysteine desulfurase [Citrifermentans bremense]